VCVYAVCVYTDGAEVKMINFAKCLRIAKILEQIGKWQRIPYPIAPVDPIQRYIQDPLLVSGVCVCVCVCVCVYVCERRNSLLSIAYEFGVNRVMQSSDEAIESDEFL